MALLGIYICRVSSSAGITLKCSFSCLLLNYCIDVDIVILYYTPVLLFTIIIIVIHSVHILYFSCPYSEKCNFGRWTLLLYTIETVNFFVCSIIPFCHNRARWIRIIFTLIRNINFCIICMRYIHNNNYSYASAEYYCDTYFRDSRG